MVKYLADTNIFLRAYFQDTKLQHKKAKQFFLDCKKGKIGIVVLSEIIPEIEYVLRKVYKIEKSEIVNYLLSLVASKYLEIEKRDIWRNAIHIYSKNNIDIIDSLLYIESRLLKNEIISFDQDFRKIKNE